MPGEHESLVAAIGQLPNNQGTQRSGPAQLRLGSPLTSYSIVDYAERTTQARRM